MKWALNITDSKLKAKQQIFLARPAKTQSSWKKYSSPISKRINHDKSSYHWGYKLPFAQHTLHLVTALMDLTVTMHLQSKCVFLPADTCHQSLTFKRWVENSSALTVFSVNYSVINPLLHQNLDRRFSDTKQKGLKNDLKKICYQTNDIEFSLKMSSAISNNESEH